MIDLTQVGAAPSRTAGGAWRVAFGVYLPGITYNAGYRVPRGLSIGTSGAARARVF